jgi:peptidoglycan/xylan/chitin deacetylase (PgdA/CDA1 family)
MYHHVNMDDYSNTLDVIEQHISYITSKFRITLPGENGAHFKTSVCIVFDDAYFDFYHYVFPLLKKYQCKVLLSVPVRFILDDTDIVFQRRISLNHSQHMAAENYAEYACFCTWKELIEMGQSGLVQLASHSLTHVPLPGLPEKTLHQELQISKKIIEQKINREINSFVFPYGMFDDRVMEQALQMYRYVFAIGQRANWSWQKQPLYRLCGDGVADPRNLLSIRYRWKYIRATLHQTRKNSMRTYQKGLETIANSGLHRFEKSGRCSF